MILAISKADGAVGIFDDEEQMNAALDEYGIDLATVKYYKLEKNIFVEIKL
jgi:hypothetical protein